jgi:hypothetical protein
VGRAREDLKKRRSLAPEPGDVLHAVRPGVSSEGVVDIGATNEVRPLLQKVTNLTNRVAVRVFDDRGHAPRGRGCGPRRKVLPRWVAGLHEMDMCVDASRKDQEVGRIDRTVCSPEIEPDRLDTAVDDP